MGSYTHNNKQLSMVNDSLVLGGLVLFDLYENKLIELFIRVNGRSISIRCTDPAMFPILEECDSFDVARNLLIVPLVKEPPKFLPTGEKALYGEILRLAYGWGDARPICSHDYLVSIKTNLYLNMHLLECRAWLIDELSKKNIITVTRKMLIFFTHTLTDKGM